MGEITRERGWWSKKKPRIEPGKLQDRGGYMRIECPQ